MSGQEATIERMVFVNLLGLRMAGATLAVSGVIAGLVIGWDEISRTMRGNELNVAQRVVACIALAFGGLGVWLYARGRRARRHPLYRLLTTDAATIQSLRVLGFVNRPFSHVFVGLQGGRERQLMVPGDGRSALELFRKIAPQATLVTTPDRRAPAGRSEYER
jgi:hypothetical protein